MSDSLFDEVVIYYSFSGFHNGDWLFPVNFEWDEGGRMKTRTLVPLVYGECTLDRFRDEFCEEHPDIDSSLIRFEEGFWKQKECQK